MNFKENISFATLTTLRVGGTARYVFVCTSVEDVQEAVAFAEQKGIWWYVLGEGSNVLAPECMTEGVIIRMVKDEITWNDEGDSVLLVGDAGVSWDSLVEQSVVRGLWGIENLAAIPGSLGAAPVQNIGAYGVECADTFVWADVYDTRIQAVVRLSNEECLFGYRDSIFKKDSRYIILSVALRLSKKGCSKIDYPDITREVLAGAVVATPMDTAYLIRSIRSNKFPDMTHVGTAGSFFKNPILTKESALVLVEKYPGIPHFPCTEGVKIPLAYILDKILHLNGFSNNYVGLYERQPLVLVTHVGATAQGVEDFANDIASRVYRETGILIEREVRTLP